jgi:phage gp29-like protein
MPSLKEHLRAALIRFLPTEGFSHGDNRREPPSFLPSLSADKIASVLAGAENGDTRDLFNLYRDVLLADNHLQAEISKRLLAVLGSSWDIVPEDAKSPEDAAVAKIVKDQLKGISGFLDVCGHLLKASIWPVALVQKTYKISQKPGLQFDLATLRAVPDLLLDYTTGKLRVELCDDSTGSPNGQFVIPEPERYVVHRGHLLSTPDNWGGPMRSLLYWFFLGIMDREWWARFLDKFGSPFFLGKFTRDDNKSRAVLERAFKLSTKIGGLVVNRDTQVELIQAAASQTGEAFERFHAVCNREKSKLILGQTLSAEPQATGLGSGTSDLQSEVRQDLRQWDELKLRETIQDQIIKPFQMINGLAGNCRIEWGGKPVADLDKLSKALANLTQAGLTVADSGLSDLSAQFSLPIVRAGSVKPQALALLSAPNTAPEIISALDALTKAGAPELAATLRAEIERLTVAALAADSPETARRRLLDSFESAADLEAAILAGSFNAQN